MEKKLWRPVGISRRILVVLAWVCLLFVVNTSVSAVGQWAPDAGDFSAGNRVWLLVSQAGDGNALDAPNARLTIYSTSKTPTITIENPNQCRGGDPDTTNNPKANLEFTTVFQFSWDGGKKEPNGSKDSNNDQWGANYVNSKGSGKCTAANNEWVTSFNLPETSARTVDGTKYYIVDLLANIRGDVIHGAVNAFKVKSSSGIVSFNSASSRKFALQDREGADGDYSTFNLYFALPCNAADQDKKFEWFDADQGQSNQDKEISYELWRKPRNGGAWEKQSGPVTALGGNDAAGSKTHWLGKDYIYNWKWIDVQKTNGIQFEIPFNSINASLACKDVASVTPLASLDPTDGVSIGETVTAAAGLKNDSDFTARVTYTRQFWKANATDDFSAADGDVALHAAVTDTVDITANTTLDLTDWTTTAVGTHNYICTALVDVGAVDTADVNTTVTTDTVGPICSPVGKFPSFAVRAGDMRTGGSYGVGSCSRVRPVAIQSDVGKLRKYFGVIAHDYVNIDSSQTHHSFVRDGVVSLGDIENIVTKKDATGNGADTTLHFARGPGPVQAANTVLGGGRFYGEFADMPALPAPMKTHCLSPIFDTNRYPQSTQTFVAVGNVTVRNMPAPGAGVKATTYNICGTTADKLLVLNGPSGGDLQLSAGQQYIVRITQNGVGCNTHPVHVRINKNIRYVGTATAINKVPQFVLLAGGTSASRVHIQVDNAVTRLDGIYAIRGSSRFLTCAQRANSPTGRTGSRNIVTTDCSNQLRVNGAIILAGRLEPYRSAGHGSVANTEPAEIFTLRPDIVLGDFARDRTGSQLEDVNRRELAPRF